MGLKPHAPSERQKCSSAACVTFEPRTLYLYPMYIPPFTSSVWPVM